jgi:hypothetical protein
VSLNQIRQLVPARLHDVQGNPHIAGEFLLKMIDCNHFHPPPRPLVFFIADLEKISSIP